jgi:hypothetical protein
MVKLSKEFLIRLKFNEKPQFRIAQEADVNPTTLSKIISGSMTTKFSWIWYNHAHFSRVCRILSGRSSIFINFLNPGSTRSV